MSNVDNVLKLVSIFFLLRTVSSNTNEQQLKKEW